MVAARLAMGQGGREVDFCEEAREGGLVLVVACVCVV